MRFQTSIKGLIVAIQTSSIRFIFLISLLISFAGTSLADDKTSTLSTSEINKIVDARVKAILAERQLDGENFDNKVEQAIFAFINKQQQQKQAQQRDQQKQLDEKAKFARQVDPKIDHIYGDPDAPVTLIEYSDFECPFCKRFHLSAKKLIDENPGKINWVYRHFPLQFHNPGAQKQSEASECAAELGGDKAFWTYSDLIYERTTSNGKGFPVSKLVPLAVEIGLSKSKFSDCLESGRQAGKVKKDFEDGTRAGITGTPGNIIRHNKTGELVVVSGAQPYERLQSALNSILQKVAQK